MLLFYARHGTTVNKIGAITNGNITGASDKILRMLKSAKVDPMDEESILALSGSYIMIVKTDVAMRIGTLPNTSPEAPSKATTRRKRKPRGVIAQKGGLGSGHWGHQGLDGVWGGSGKRTTAVASLMSKLEASPELPWGERSSPEGQIATSAHQRRLATKLFKHPIVTVYHGTMKNNVDGITKNGLKTGKEWYGRPSAVYFLTSKDDADKLIKNFVFTKEFAIVKAEVPREFLQGARIDAPGNRDFGVTTAAFITKNIPAEFITEVELYERKSTPGVFVPPEEGWPVEHTGTITLKEKSNNVTIYVLIAVVDDKAKKVGILE